MRAELDIYSGRPNPSWSMDPSRAVRVRVAVRALVRAPQGQQMPDGLGYRGFVVDAEVRDIVPWHRLFVFRDLVLIEAEEGSRLWSDAERIIESVLLEDAAGHVDAELLQQLRRV